MPDLLGALHAKQEVSHKRLPAQEKLVRQVISRPDLEGALRDQAAQQGRLLGTDFHVVLDGNELAVHPIGGRPFRLQTRQNRVEQGNQFSPELLKRKIPLAIQVGTEHKMGLILGSLGRPAAGWWIFGLLVF